MKTKSAHDFSSYIARFPEDVQARLIKIRQEILDIVPTATEGISYGMPAFRLKGKPLVYFAAYKNHIGFYATPTGHAEFAKELSQYKQGKGSVQFPLTDTLPYKLIRRIVAYRADYLNG